MSILFSRSLFSIFFSLVFLSISSSALANNSNDKYLHNKTLLQKKEVFDDAHFDANQMIRRGEFLKWTLRNSGFSAKRFHNGSEPFFDIHKRQDLYPYVASAYASGALSSFEKNKKFLPTKTISRVKALEIIFSIEGISAFQKYPKSANYKDIPADKKERAIMIKAIEMGYITPKNNSIFPKKRLTKGEAVNILARITRKKNVGIIRKKETPLSVTESLILKKSLQKKDLSAKKLEEEALNGMVNSLGDKYSVYMPPQVSENFNNYINNTSQTNKYAGIGVAITKKENGGLIITNVFNGPAQKAKLQVGDEIITVDGEDITPLPISTITAKIKGIIGTSVAIGVQRNHQKFSVLITRGEIDSSEYKNVNVETKNNIVWISIHGFKRDTSQDFSDALKNNITEEIKGVVIDLRYNSGGLLSAAQNMLGEVLPAGDLVVRMNDGDGKEDLIKVKGSGDFLDIPMVVVQNEYSASASEIFSGSIQDYQRGVIIGKTSFGKGVAQSLYSLSNGGQLKLTTNEFFTPLGNSVHGVGITPDIEVEKTDNTSLWKVVKRILR